MKKKKYLIPIVVIGVILILFIGGVSRIVAKGYGVSAGRYLEAKNGTAMLVLDNSPIQMSNRTDKDLFDKLDIGDKIIVIHDGIAESYPGKTGVYAVFKLSDGKTGDIPRTVVNELIDLGWLETEEQSGGTFPNEAFDIAVAYANWTDAEEIYSGALNADKMAISIVQHLPIYMFDTLAELEQFKLSFSEVLTMDYGYDEVPSFNEVTAKYDKAFFEENTLMLVYIATNSGSLRFGVDNVFCDGTSFCIHAKHINNPEVVTEDMAGWFITVAVPDSMVATCNEFDAKFNNNFN